MKFNGPVRPTWKEGTILLNRVQNICLFPVSKNANTSLRYALGTGLYTQYHKEDISDMIKLAVVRDPADRIISSYLEILKLRQDQHRDYTVSLPFYKIAGTEERFRQFLVDIYDNIYDTHLLPQVYQIFRPSHVDYWILFDNYLKDLMGFIKKYGIRTHHDPIVNINKTSQQVLQASLRKLLEEDKELREHIRYEMYPEDTELYKKIKHENKNI